MRRYLSLYAYAWGDHCVGETVYAGVSMPPSSSPGVAASPAALGPPLDVFDYHAQPKVAVRCPLCGAENASTPAVDRFGYKIGVSACACGLRYLNPRLTLAGYGAFYESGAYRRMAAARRYHPPAEHARDKRVQGETIAGYLRYAGIQGAQRFLDAGGSDGVVTTHLARTLALSSVTIWDPAIAELRQARTYGYATFQGTLEHSPPPGLIGPFDGILCGQTIEHLCEPLVALHTLRTLGTGWLWIDRIQTVLKIDHPLYWTDTSLRLALTKTGWIPRRACHMRKRGQTGYLCD